MRPGLAAAGLDLAPLSRLIAVPTAGVPGFLLTLFESDILHRAKRFAERPAWEQRPQPYSDALAGVLGRTRALLLAAPASTTDLARRIGLTPGGVSRHLTVLRAAGLVNAHRTGRVVLYGARAWARRW